MMNTAPNSRPLALCSVISVTRPWSSRRLSCSEKSAICWRNSSTEALLGGGVVLARHAEVNSYNSHSLVAATEYDLDLPRMCVSTLNNMLTLPPRIKPICCSSATAIRPRLGLSNSEKNDWSDFLADDAGVDKVYAVGFGGIDDTDFLDPMAPRPSDEAIAVEDPDQLAATLEGSLPERNLRNVLLGSDSVAGGVDDVLA